MSRSKPGRDQVHWLDRGWQTVQFGWVPSERAWKAEVKRLGAGDCPYPTAAGCCTEFVDAKYGVCALVTIRPELAMTCTRGELIGLIVHEATHVWQFVRHHMNEASPSKEFEAYAMQAIAQSLIEAVNDTWGGLLAERPAT